MKHVRPPTSDVAILVQNKPRKLATEKLHAILSKLEICEVMGERKSPTSYSSVGGRKLYNIMSDTA
jgi:hypothetical protein